jgi:hypothetical protein
MTVTQQQLCSCCPAVESLACALTLKLKPAALKSLLQLSALTSLRVSDLGAAAAAAVEVAAQLTRLKQLTLAGLPQLSGPALMQFTVLTGLQALEVAGGPMHLRLTWKNKVQP